MYLKKLLTIKNNKKLILIVGIGKENKQFINWLINIIKFPQNQIILADRNEIKIDYKNFFKIFTGPSYLDSLLEPNIEMVIKAPGIHSLLAEFENFRNKNGANTILSSLTFFVEKYRSQIIGITGTKGKSTVCSLTNHILNSLEKTSIKSYYCGNTTNISPYKFWKERNIKVDSNVYFVVELSSFQLQDLGYAKISPKFAGITNYYIDHLDQHLDKTEYWDAKNNIFKYQKKDDLLITTSEVLKKINPKNLHGIITNLGIKNIQQIAKDLNFILPGNHNKTNLALTLTISKSIYKNEYPDLQKILNTYKPLPFRSQLINTLETNFKLEKETKKLQINWINDGAATEPDAVAAAIQTFGRSDFLWVQFTGLSKQADYEKVLKSLFQTQKLNTLFRVDYCGEVGREILESLYQKIGVKQTIQTSDFMEIVTQEIGDYPKITKAFETWVNQKLLDLKSTGETELIKNILDKKLFTLNILLSPCGTSFDLFSNYTERAEFWNKHTKSQKVKPE
jgi:UDP-N-acetylmuramoyl-L-alanine---L-glutamate ligase